MAKFQGVDYYQMDSLLSEEEILVRDTVREFVDDKVLPIIEHHNRTGSFPRELVPAMAELGMFGATLPAKYGCAEMNNVAYGLVMQELERGDSGIRSFASVQSALVMYPIFTFGSDEQKNRWLPKLADGTKIGCFGLTEPDFGSNPGGMITRAEEKPDGYLLNGAKMWITNGTIADVAVVWAKMNGVVHGYPRGKGDEGIYRARNARQAFPPRVGDVRIDFSGLPDSEGKPSAENRRFEIAPDVSEPGTLRHRLGRDRIGDGLLRCGAQLFKIPHTIRESNCVISADAGKTGLHADRDHESTASLSPARPAEGSGQSYGTSRYRSRSGTMSLRRWRSLGLPAKSSARTESWTSTR